MGVWLQGSVFSRRDYLCFIVSGLAFGHDAAAQRPP